MIPGLRSSAHAPRGRRWRTQHRRVLAALVIVLAIRSWSQQAPPSEDPPSIDAQPGQGAQVHTGTASGLSLETRLQTLLADHQYDQIATQLDQLAAQDANLYRGLLANHSNNLKSSIDLLEPLVDSVSASGDTNKEKLLRQALAEDYLRSGDLSKAAAAYAAMESRLAAKLSTDEQDAIELPVKLLPLAKDNPPTAVDPCDPFTLDYERDPLGLMDVPVFIDAKPKTWMLDPTAPFNLIDRATAVDVGLKLSAETATIHTLTGQAMRVHMALIPRFTIGGRVTLHNMTVFVFDDADYSFPHSHYQVEGVLGYPALSALGSITVTDHSTIEVHPAKETGSAQPDDRLTDGAPFYLDNDQVIVALGRGDRSDAAGGGDRMFAVDAAGEATYLTSRYFDEHAADFNTQKLADFSIPGQQPAPAYTAETVIVRVGKAPVELHFIPVLTQPLGSAALDDVYGVLGQDALGQFRSYTFDYRTMRFAVEPER